MKYLVYFVLLLAIHSNLIAGDLSKSECEKVGDTHSKIGCLMLNDSEKAKYKNSKMYKPDKETCKCLGGVWNEVEGCIAKVSAEQCASVGGKIQDGNSCVPQMSREKCKELGGIYNGVGACFLNRKPTLSPSSNKPNHTDH